VGIRKVGSRGLAMLMGVCFFPFLGEAYWDGVGEMSYRDAWLCLLCLLCLESGDQIVTHARLREAWLLSRVYT
jgi:hypothetical protein